MPPKTAMRSSIALSAGRVRTKCPVLITGVTRLMPQRVGGHRFCERASQSRIRRLDQDRANVHAPVRDDTAVVANQQTLVKVVQHLGRHALVCLVTTKTRD